MLMICFKRACVACLTLCSVLVAQFCLADYLGSNPAGGPTGITGNVYRYTDSGATVPNSFLANVPQSVKDQTETIFESTATTPNRAKLYSFTNTLGRANYVLAFDISTNQYLAADSFKPSGVGEDYVDNARQPFIVGNEIFVSSFINFATGSNRQVKRFSLTSHSLLETIDPPTAQSLNDIALNSSGSSLFVAGTAGIFRYTKLGGTYENGLTTLIIPGVTGYIAFGPDSQLYVRNSANGDVERYTTSGAFVDTFLSHLTYPNLGTLQFDLNGNLDVFPSGASPIRKFNAVTGSLLLSTSAGLISTGRITYLPVPEPAGCGLIAIGIAFVAGRRGNRR
jgi:hypothetical protein